MRSILVHADNSPAMECRLQAALDIARANSGHVTLHINTPLQRFVAMDPFGGAYLSGEALRHAQEHDDALAQRLSDRMAQEDVPWNIEASNSEPISALANSARLADLVVVSIPAPLDEEAVAPFSAGSLAMAVRAPVLAIPSDRATFPLGSGAMVAWDGGHESSLALRKAVPMLQLAGRVDVVTIAEKTDRFPPTEALRYLSQYGISAELHERERTHPTIEETLEATAQEIGADWIVMGAYGHSRLRETIFGGVTRYFLDFARFPLLLAH